MPPCHSPTLVCAQRPPVARVLGRRNTALHVAASSKRANGRTAMVAFLIAERGREQGQQAGVRSAAASEAAPAHAVLCCAMLECAKAKALR